MSAQKNRRKNYFIDKEFQSKFIIKFCTVIICASVLSAFLIYFFNLQTTTVAFEDLRLIVKTTSDYIFPIVLHILAIVTLMSGLTAIFVTLFASHKIAGPLYKLKIELDVIKAGNLSRPIRIRSTDQLQSIATAVDDFRRTVSQSLKTLNIIATKLDSISHTVNDKDLKLQINNLKDELGKYTV
jgi:methyl-accepting chemotaxis protein